MRLTVDHVVTPSGVLDDAVVVVDGERIAGIERRRHEPPTEPAGPADETLAGWLVPGFVDTHTHGGARATFATTDPAEALRAAAFHRRHGSTTLYASLVTASMDDLCAQLRTLAPLVHAGELAGIHLEGPFLAPQRKGAHDSSLLCDPTPDRVDRLLDAGEGAVAMVTLAPERPFGLDAVRRFTDAGVRVAFGHSDADATLTRRALDAGATVVTHAFNAMRPIHHRDPGPLPALLHDPRVLVELICDGVHLHRDIVAMTVDACGTDRVALVTDAMAAAGAPDGAYELGTLAVRVVDGVARLTQPDGTLGSIAGSTLTMDRAYSFAADVTSRADAAALAATNPARWHHLSDTGILAVGAWADCCLVDADGALLRVMRHGRWLPVNA